MQALFVLLTISALAAIVSTRLARRFAPLSALTSSGLLFLVLGAFAGPMGAAIFSAESLFALQPLVALGLGAAGLMIGLNLDVRVLRHVPPALFGAAWWQGLGAFLAVAVPMAVVLAFGTSLPLSNVLGGAAMLGAASSVSSGHHAILWHRSGQLDRVRGLGVALLSMLDDLFGILVLAVALMFGASARWPVGLGLIGVAVLIGLLCGGLLAFLLRGTDSEDERIAVLLGGIALVSGAAAYLRVSSLIAGVICGWILTVVGGRYADDAYDALLRFERPLFLSLVFLLGVHVELTNWMVWPLLLVMVAFRLLGRVVVGRSAGRIASRVMPVPPDLGYALLSQGPLSLCLAFEYSMLVHRGVAQLLFDVVALGAVVNEILGARLFGRSLNANRPGPPRPEAQPPQAQVEGAP